MARSTRINLERLSKTIPTKQQVPTQSRRNPITYPPNQTLPLSFEPLRRSIYAASKKLCIEAGR
ncbi:hypothetical protein B9Z19DRAFT_609971 [Tuber borchii]|uniref:Uncharacterized protein n=1 Tax=Tuber borchii TaxID=42251 RepID=A0A2T7A100_TUBBO|nr:hypothetical protein B9Z19DRAFT_609971 [Tuber borchii]